MKNQILNIIFILSCLLIFSFSNNENQSVKIGTQVWMTENLNVDKFRNGDPILEAKTAKEWQTGGPKWCYYDYDPANGSKYGKLYNWYAVNDPRGLAPEGWHVPSDKEWTVLTKYLGGKEIAGGKMKSTGTEFWESPNTGATNESGFSGLPGGYCNINGTFNVIRNTGTWWSSTENDELDHLAWSRLLSYKDGGVRSTCDGKPLGRSVRCLRD